MDRSKILGESATMGRRWMMQMNDGCAASNVTIQLTMTHPRQILQSVEMSAATNTRASGDYIHPGPGGGHQYEIGITSILAHAVGLAPSKVCRRCITTHLSLARSLHELVLMY